MALPTVPDGTGGVFCSGCSRWQAAAAFSRNRARPNGLQFHCRECRSAHYRRSYAQRRGGVVKVYGAVVPDGYVARRAGKTERQSAAEFGVSMWVIRRWDRETGFVSHWAQRRRLHARPHATTVPAPIALSPRPSALAEAGISSNLLSAAMAAFGARPAPRP